MQRQYVCNVHEAWYTAEQISVIIVFDLIFHVALMLFGGIQNSN